MNQQRHEGTLKKWNAERGFGIIVAHEDGHDIFVHASAFPDDGYLPTVGEVLTFDIGPDRSGKRDAVRVQRFIDPVPQGAQNGGRPKKLRLSKSPSSSAGPSPSRRGQKVVVLVLLAALAVLAYSRYAKRAGQIEAAAQSTVF
jgi:cold shock CspA family protein